MIRPVEWQDGEEERQFEDDFRRGAASLGDRSRSVNESVARLWAYGEGYGATHGYDAIQRQLRPTQKALGPIGEIS